MRKFLDFVSTVVSARTIHASVAAARRQLAADQDAFAQKRAASLADEAELAASKAVLAATPKYYRLRRQYAKNFETRSKLPKAYAILGTTGRSATHWITAAFNLHDSVLFSHGLDLEPKKTKSDEERLVTFLRMAEQMDSFLKSADEYFDLLEAQAGYLAYGNVHGLAPPSMADNPGERFRREYYSCAILRQPILRAESLVRRWNYEAKISETRKAAYSVEYFLKHRQDIILKLTRDYGVSAPDQDALLFSRAIDTTIGGDHYYIEAGIPLYQMERLVADTDYFLSLFYDATAGLVDIDDQYLEKLRALKPIDQRGEPSSTARHVFSSWAPWKQRYFLDELAKNSMADAYDAVGYNLHFIVRSR